MDKIIEHAINEIDRVASDSTDTFGRLDVMQLNWKPSEKEWSVAQCFDHVITINSRFFPRFEQLRSADVTNTFWEKYSPLSGYFGRFLNRVVSPEYEKKFKTSKKAYPSARQIDDGIIARFGEHQQQLVEHLRNISSEIDLKKTIVTSPLLGVVTYSLADALTMLPAHERRHFQQAKRVTAMDGFPKTESSKGEVAEASA